MSIGTGSLHVRMGVGSTPDAVLEQQRSGKTRLKTCSALRDGR